MNEIVIMIGLDRSRPSRCLNQGGRCDAASKSPGNLCGRIDWIYIWTALVVILASQVSFDAECTFGSNLITLLYVSIMTLFHVW